MVSKNDEVFVSLNRGKRGVYTLLVSSAGACSFGGLRRISGSKILLNQ